VAIVERIFADRGDAVGDVIMFGLTPRKLDKRSLVLIEQYAIHTNVVSVERVHCDFRQAGATHERLGSDRGDAVGDGDAGQAGATIEHIVSDRGDAVGDGDAGQAGAFVERIGSDRGDAVGDGDAGQAGAQSNRIISDAGDTVGDGDTGQARAIVERIIFDYCDAVGDVIVPRLTPRKLDKRSLALVEQYALRTTVASVEGIYYDRRQVPALTEC